LYEEPIFFHTSATTPIEEGSIDVADLSVYIEPTVFSPPAKYSRFSRDALTYFKERRKINYDPDSGSYENNRSARVVKVDADESRIILQEASYFDQIATNIVVDTEYRDSQHGRLDSYREGLEQPIDGRLPPLESSTLANTLGVAAVLYTEDFSHEILRVRNGKFLASMSDGGIHCSASGVFELPPWAERANTYDFDIIKYGMEIEFRTELGLEPSQYDLYPVALCRELPRAGKPQFFFVARLRIPTDKLVLASKNAKERNEFIQNEEGGLLLDHTTDNEHNSYTYEGLAAIHFSKKFLMANDFCGFSNEYSTFS